MVALLACPACSIHVRGDEPRCPHCGAALRGPSGARRASRVALLMGFGVGLAACPAEPPIETKYGVPATPTPAKAPPDAAQDAPAEPSKDPSKDPSKNDTAEAAAADEPAAAKTAESKADAVEPDAP